MTLRHVTGLLVMLFAAGTASADVLRVADLNTRQIRALDRAKTMVILQGGMLEEHGPYLPAFTDGVLSQRLATSDVHPRITGDIAVVTGRLQRTGPGPNARVVSDDWRFRKVYRRDASGWRVISYHAWEPPK